MSAGMLCWTVWAACHLVPGSSSESRLVLRGQNDVSGKWTTRFDDAQVEVNHQTNASGKYAWSYGDWELSVTLADPDSTPHEAERLSDMTGWDEGVVIVDVNSRQDDTDELQIGVSPELTTPASVRYPGYTRFLHLGQYRLYLEPLSWVDAREKCDSEQGYLAIVNSQREADAITGLYGRDVDAAFVGLSNLQSGGHFVSVLDEPLEELGYDSWSDGRPDPRRGKKCVVMFRTGMLSVTPCDKTLPYVCEAWRMA